MPSLFGVKDIKSRLVNLLILKDFGLLVKNAPRKHGARMILTSFRKRYVVGRKISAKLCLVPTTGSNI